jgi:hypothetical protein
MGGQEAAAPGASGLDEELEHRDHPVRIVAGPLHQADPVLIGLPLRRPIVAQVPDPRAGARHLSPAFAVGRRRDPRADDRRLLLSRHGGRHVPERHVG